MGFAMRNGGSGTITVNVMPLGKTSVKEAGLYDVQLPDGTPIVVLSYMLWPSHDEGAIAIADSLLASYKARCDVDPSLPKPVVIIAGGALHSEAFKKIADERDDVEDLVGSCEIPIICGIRKQAEGMEERFLALAKAGGEFLAHFAEVSGGHVYYIPSISHLLPNEFELFRWVRKEKAKADKKGDNHAKEYVPGPDIPEAFDQFLQLHENPNVTVLKFGAALRVNKRHRFKVLDFRRRHPGSAAIVDVEQVYEDVIAGFDGKVSSAWWTTPKHTLGESHRRWWQAHEVGNMFDLSKQLGYLRDYDRRAKGLWAGYVEEARVFGYSFVLLRGADGRRGIVVDGEPFDEPTPGGYGNMYELPTPGCGPDAEPTPAPVASAAPAPPSSPSAPKPRKRAPKSTGKTGGKAQARKATSRRSNRS